MKKKVEELFERMLKGVTSLLSTGKIAEFLAFQAKFHRYSFNNVLLIFLQYPKATQVAGMKKWNELGRKVKKGEKGIAIFAPRKKKIGTLKETNGITGDEEERSIFLVTGFQVVYVFDVSQTEGKTLPERPVLVEVSQEQENGLLDRLLRICPVPVTEVPKTVLRNGRGDYSPDKQAIRLRADLNPAMKAKTLMHEISHHLVFSVLGEDSWAIRATEINGYARGEIIAEGAAYIAAAHFGLDTSQYSFTYLAIWAEEPENMLKWGSAVQKTASALIDLVESDDYQTEYNEKQNIAV